MGGVDQIGLDGEIVVEEVRRPARIGEDAADRRRRDDDDIGALGLHPVLGRLLAAEIDLAAAHRQDLAALARQAPHDGAAHHAAMAGDEDPPPLQSEERQRLWRLRSCSSLTTCRSDATISATSSRKLTLCFQPSLALALAGSP